MKKMIEATLVVIAICLIVFSGVMWFGIKNKMIVISSKNEDYTIARSYNYPKKIDANNWRTADGHIDHRGRFHGTSMEARLMAFMHPYDEVVWETDEGTITYLTYEGDVNSGVYVYRFRPSTVY